MSEKRKPNHCEQGRPYAGTLTGRAEAAKAMIGEMCSKGRPPAMSVPAGDCVHATRCGDEDIYITDLIDDLLHGLAQRDGWQHAFDVLFHKESQAGQDDQPTPAAFDSVFRVLRRLRITQPDNPPTNVTDDICGGIRVDWRHGDHLRSMMVDADGHAWMTEYVKGVRQGDSVSMHDPQRDGWVSVGERWLRLNGVDPGNAADVQDFLESTHDNPNIRNLPPAPKGSE